MDDIEILSGFVTPERLLKIRSVLDSRTRELTVVLDRLNKPHNFMAILRTCEAFGVQDVHIIPQSGSPTSISGEITRGADKWLTIHFHKSWRECFARLRENGYRIFASFLGESKETIEALPATGRIALLFGNELDGLDPETIAASDGRFMLPMLGFCQSFNVSVACALSIQKLSGLRESRENPWPPLPEPEKSALMREWLMKSIPRANELLEEVRRRQAAPG